MTSLHWTVPPPQGAQRTQGSWPALVLSQRMVSLCHGVGQPSGRVSGVWARANREVLVPDCGTDVLSEMLA